MTVKEIRKAVEVYDTSFCDFDVIIFLLSEIDRLKEGKFTEKEFQNLCHNFSAEDKGRFKEGCIEYQKKLFGE